MKKTLFISASLLGSSLFIAQSVQAADSEAVLQAGDFTFQPRVMAGVMRYSFEEKFKQEHGGNIGTYESGEKLRDNLPFIGFGGTLSYDRFFIDAYVQRSGEGEDGGSSKTDDFFVANNSPVDFKRKDYAITLGYGVTDRLSIFGGYKYGQTDFERLDTLASIGFVGDTFFKESVHSEFKQDGPFIGATYGWQLGNGLFGLNIAVAKMDGEKTRHTVVTGSSNHQSTSIFSDDTLGVTFGISWKAPITKNLMYGLSLDGYRYDFDLKGSYNYLSGGKFYTSENAELNIEETVFSVKASLIYRF